MAVGNKPSIVSLELLVSDRGFYAKHVIRIALVGDQMARFDRFELGRGEAETLGDLAEELLFLPMHFGVGLGFQHVLEQFAIAPE